MQTPETLQASSIVALHWKQYIETLFPVGCHPVQRDELEKAFYGGAAVMLSLLQNLPDNEDIAMTMLSQLTLEIEEYAEARRAKPQIIVPGSPL